MNTFSEIPQSGKYRIIKYNKRRNFKSLTNSKMDIDIRTSKKDFIAIPSAQRSIGQTQDQERSRKANGKPISGFSSLQATSA